MGLQSPSLNGPIFGTVELERRGFRDRFSLRAEVDLGSHCMVVTCSIFDTNFLNNVMHELRCPILNFDGSEIESIEGYFRMTAFFNGQQCSASIYIANDSCELVIGWDLLTRLGMTVKFGSQTVHCTEPESSLSAQKSDQVDHNSQPSVNTRLSSSLSRSISFCPQQVSSLSLSSLVKEIPEAVQMVINQPPNLTSKEIRTFLDGQHQTQLTAKTIPIAVKMKPIPCAIPEKVAGAICQGNYNQDILLKRIAAEGMTLTKLQSATAEDPILQQVIPFVNGHWPAKTMVPPDLLAYYHIQGGFAC